MDAGTYVNDFATVTTKITIEGVGGMAEFVANEPPPNEKGILTVDNDVTVENCGFSGCAISDAEGGNGAGIRYEGGQMTLENDSFENNQNGILGAPSIGGLTNTVTVDHCLFLDNGSGTGSTHNFYMGNVTQVTFTNNISEGAVVGHEFKSRAYSNDIENNVFADGPTGDASYEIDLPDGGADTVSGNVIEKGPDGINEAMVHFGGEGIPYAGSSLLVFDNQFVNEFGAAAVAVLNQTAISVDIAGNEFDSFDAANIASGPATEKANFDGQGNVIADQTLSGVLPGSTLIITDPYQHAVTLDGSLLAVEGGAGLLNVTAVVGHVVAIGGSGGMDFTEVGSSGGNTVTTLAGSSNSLTLIGQDLVDSEGHDTITCGICNVSGQLGGDAQVRDGTGNDQWIVTGTAAITGEGGNPVIAVGPQGSLQVAGGGWLHARGEQRRRFRLRRRPRRRRGGHDRHRRCLGRPTLRRRRPGHDRGGTHRSRDPADDRRRPGAFSRQRRDLRGIGERHGHRRGSRHCLCRDRVALAVRTKRTRRARTSTAMAEPT